MTLTDRYIDAVEQYLPKADRAEADRELQVRIAEEIDGARASGASDDQAEREVLQRLGHPASVAGQYTADSLVLVGPKHYLQWRRLLLLLWTTLVPVITLATFVVSYATEGQLGSAIGQTIGITVGAIVTIGFWVTASYAVIDRAGQAEPWTLDALPEASDPPMRPSDVLGISATLVLFGGWLIWQNSSRLVTDASGAGVPALDPGLWSFWLPYFLVWILVMIATKVALLRTGRWTLPLAVGNAVLFVAFTVPALVLALSDRLINPAIVTELTARGAQDLDNALFLTAIVVVLCIAGPLLWGAISAFRKALAHRR